MIAALYDYLPSHVNNLLFFFCQFQFNMYFIAQPRGTKYFTPHSPARGDSGRVRGVETFRGRVPHVPGGPRSLLFPTRAARPRASPDGVVGGAPVRQAPDLQALHPELFGQGRLFNDRRVHQRRQCYLRSTGRHQHREARLARRRPTRHRFQHHWGRAQAQELPLRHHRAWRRA